MVYRLMSLFRHPSPRRRARNGKFVKRGNILCARASKRRKTHKEESDLKSPNC